MKLIHTRSIFPLLPIALSASALLMARDSDDEQNYRHELHQANDEIDIIRTAGDAVCPITSLIVTCGDNICEPGFENEELCAADCMDAKLKSFNHQISCPHVKDVYYPESIHEIQILIRGAKTRGERVRVIGSRHSANQQLCTDGIIISMENMKDVVGIERGADGKETVEVSAGITMGELSDWLHAHNRSLGYAQLGFRNASVGGAIATGAHGSSHKHSSVISSSVRAATIVTGEGQIIELTEGDGDTLRALRAHLGLMGVVVKVKLEIQPQFKLHVTMTDHNDSVLFADQGLSKAIKNCDYSFINWFPAKGKFIKGCGVETRERVDRGAENTLLNPKIPPGLILPYKVVLHYGMCYGALNELLEGLRYQLFKWQPPFQKKNFLGFVKNSDDLVGYSHRMMSSKFIDADEHFFQNDREIAIPISQVPQALLSLRRHIQREGMHFPLFGVFLRFAPSEDKTLLAHTSSFGAFKNGEPVVLLELISPAPVGFPKDMAEEVDRPFEDFSNTLITDFYGRPHWGKNKEWVFALIREKNVYGHNLDLFKSVTSSFDPQGIFVNDFAKRAGIAD